MPAPLPCDKGMGRFVASLKTGELFTVIEPGDEGKDRTSKLYGRGLYQTAVNARQTMDYTSCTDAT